jgi:hypothetical protein
MSPLTPRRVRAIVSAALVLSGGLVLLPGLQPGAASVEGTTATTRVTRTLFDADGVAQEEVDRTVSVTVSSTQNLRGRQNLSVSWTGALPTGGLVSDPNTGAAAGEEFPMVLLQCRGTSATITPETCWTGSSVERYTGSGTSAYPAWRIDAHATDADRSARVNAPTDRPAACGEVGAAERWVPFKAVDGTIYRGGSNACAGAAPEASDVGNTGLPSNSTYATTTAAGTGSTRFNVLSEDENASLGCSYRVDCALVAIPIVGISCDAWGTQLTDPTGAAKGSAATRANTSCRLAPTYAPGQRAATTFDGTVALTGALWWSASNWRNRVVVPLHFAVSASMCSVVNKTAPMAVYGSVLMNEITAQWSPKFCTDRSLKPFNHVQSADTAARNVITAGSASMAFSSLGDEDDYGGRPVVQAPVALTGWGIGFVIDGADGTRLTDLKLNARLIAKLLTQSYYAEPIVKANYPALARNPANITVDPEFEQLNPDVPSSASNSTAAALQFLSGDADMVYALTSYLTEDPTARAWLDGKADPWGMTVNPSYKGIDLPVTSWPLLDDWEMPKSYIDSQNNPCYSHSPSPYMQLIANPAGFISTIAQNLQYAVSAVNTACDGDQYDPTTLKLKTLGRQTPGFRFVLGLTTLTAAHRYDYELASLQTTSENYVAADDAGLKAGAALLSPNKETQVWELAWPQLSTKAGRSAYPGTLPVYADAPTVGLDATTAGRVAQLLLYAVGAGQTPGTAVGQLPPGALPMTAANGLGALAAYTRLAAEAVRTQSGTLPPPWGTAVSSGTPTPTPSSSAPAGVTVPDGAGVGVPSIDVPSAGGIATSPAAVDAPEVVTASADLRTVGATSGLGRVGLPAALWAAVLFALAGLVLRTGDGPWIRMLALARVGGARTVEAVRRRIRASRGSRAGEGR